MAVVHGVERHIHAGRRRRRNELRHGDSYGNPQPTWLPGLPVFKLIVEGFKALGRKEWDRAAAYLVVPGLIVGGFVLSIVSAAGTQATEAVRYELGVQEAEWALYHQDEAFPVKRIGGGYQIDCGPACWYATLGKYEITNSTTSLSVWFRNHGTGGCWQEGWYGIVSPGTFAPGEMRTIYCIEEKYGEPVNSSLLILTTVDLGYRTVADICFGDC